MVKFKKTHSLKILSHAYFKFTLTFSKHHFLSRRSFNSYLWDNVKNSILTTLLKFIFPNLAPTVFIMNGKLLLRFRKDSDTEVNI